MSTEYRDKLSEYIKTKYVETAEPDRCGVGTFSTDDQDFVDACTWHDKAYLKDSWHQHKMSRLEVDRYFLRQMLRLAGRNPFKILRARFYYVCARMFGAQFWEGQK